MCKKSQKLHEQPSKKNADKKTVKAEKPNEAEYFFLMNEDVLH